MYRNYILNRILTEVSAGHSIAVIVSELREDMADMAYGYMLSGDEEIKERWCIIQEFVMILQEAA